MCELAQKCGRVLQLYIHYCYNIYPPQLLILGKYITCQTERMSWQTEVIKHENFQVLHNGYYFFLRFQYHSCHMDENRYQWFFNYFLKMSDFYNHIFLISYVFTAIPWLVSDSINEMQSSVSVYYWFNFTRNPNNTTAAHWFYKSWKNISTYRVSQKIVVWD